MGMEKHGEVKIYVFYESVREARRRRLELGWQVSVSCPCGHWKLNPRPLQGQQMLSTAEPSLAPREKLKGDLKLCI